MNDYLKIDSFNSWYRKSPWTNHYDYDILWLWIIVSHWLKQRNLPPWIDITRNTLSWGESAARFKILTKTGDAKTIEDEATGGMWRHGSCHSSADLRTSWSKHESKAFCCFLIGTYQGFGPFPYVFFFQGGNMMPWVPLQVNADCQSKRSNPDHFWSYVTKCKKVPELVLFGTFCMTYSDISVLYPILGKHFLVGYTLVSIFT